MKIAWRRIFLFSGLILVVSLVWFTRFAGIDPVRAENTKLMSSRLSCAHESFDIRKPETVRVMTGDLEKMNKQKARKQKYLDDNMIPYDRQAYTKCRYEADERYENGIEDFEGTFPGDYWFPDGEGWGISTWWHADGAQSVWCAGDIDPSGPDYPTGFGSNLYIECSYYGVSSEGTDVFDFAYFGSGSGAPDDDFDAVMIEGYTQMPPHGLGTPVHYENWPLTLWDSYLNFRLGPAFDDCTYLRINFYFWSDMLGGEAGTGTGWFIDHLDFNASSNAAIYPVAYGFYSSDTQLFNLSTRAYVGTGDSISIGGLISGGLFDKQIVIQGMGPWLGQQGVPNHLQDPMIELFKNGVMVDSNNSWETRPQWEKDVMAAHGLTPGFSTEAALVYYVETGYDWTIKLKGNNNTTGNGLVAIYDTSASGSTLAYLKNLSTRAYVGTGDSIPIGGTILSGPSVRRIIVHGLGPWLQQYGVPGVLQDPVLELYKDSVKVAENDDFFTLPPSKLSILSEAGLTPDYLSEAAIVYDIEPGYNWTIKLKGYYNSTGIGLIAIYDAYHL